MTQKEIILEAFQRFGYKITLGQALQHSWGYKMASRISDLRKDGYQIECIRGEKPSDNLYVMTYVDKNGQSEMSL